MKKIVLLIVALVAISSVCRAGEAVSFKAEAPMFVTMGEPVRVSFNLNAKPDGGVAAPSFEGFDVIAGPSVSQGKSVQLINGQLSSSTNYTTTYVLLPQKEGVLTIGAASVSVDGKGYTTKPITIEVRAAGKSAENREQPAEQRAANRIQKEDLFLRLELSSRSVYKGEPLRATLRLYSRVDNIAGVESSKMPTFNGFWSQQLEVEQGPFNETVDGKPYKVYNMVSYLLYPQQDGTLTISPAEMTVVAQIVVQSNSNYDPFFGGGHETYSVRRTLKTPEIKVQIKPFPVEAPASFTGAVGNYKMSHELSSSEVAANSAITLRLKISGSGNLKFISAPKLSMPASFEAYDIKSEEKIQNKASGSTGYRSFEYPFIVRAEGDYEIEPIEFTYFDPSKGQYVTLATPALNIKVTPDKSAASPQQPLPVVVKQEDVQKIGEDIHFIKVGDPALCAVVTPFVFSSTYWVIVVAMLLIAVVCYFIIRKHIRNNRNAVLVKGKRASRVAIKRFRRAEQYMRSGDRIAFYKEMLQALWGYLSDKFNIPVADLTREVVCEELHRRGASAEAEQVIDVIARCEEAQYSPVETAEMDTLYTEGIEAISKIEKVTK